VKKDATERIDVAYVAYLARLKLSEEETGLFQSQLEDIVGYVNKVRELDVSGVQPTAHGIPVENVLRKDEPGESLPREVALKNAPAQRDNQFLVSKIVE
jgi:aspartyl-tRNA(Asn)/glutamyl-tRNA(Gln) amidotransferase subunit C